MATISCLRRNIQYILKTVAIAYGEKEFTAVWSMALGLHTRHRQIIVYAVPT